MGRRFVGGDSERCPKAYERAEPDDTTVGCCGELGSAVAVEEAIFMLGLDAAGAGAKPGIPFLDGLKFPFALLATGLKNCVGLCRSLMPSAGLKNCAGLWVMCKEVCVCG